MQFRKQDYTETSEDPRVAEAIREAHRFCLKLAPNMKEQFDDALSKFQVIVCGQDKNYKILFNDKFYDFKLTAQGESTTCIKKGEEGSFETIAVYDTTSKQAIIHETLHAFSAKMGKTEQGGLYFKKGAKYTEYDKEGKESERGHLLNETITDALASRAIGDIGPSRKGGYGYNVMMADLLIGEKIENNSLIQDVYFGNGNIFAENFNKTLINSQVKFSDYEQDFDVESDKSYELLKGAVEYNLRKASSSEEIDKVYAFQQKIINFYKSRGESIEGEKILDPVEDETTCMMDNLLNIADKMQKQCKSNLVAQRIATKQIVNQG